MEPGDSFDVTISYSAAGANSFAYSLMHNQRTDIDITVDVIGLEGSEIAKGTLPASIETVTENGEHWVWHYDGLIADRDIRLNLPEKLNYAQRVAAKQSDYRMLGAAAPWLVGLFIISLGMVLRLDNIRLRLESYLLMGFGMALFFPLLTFFSGALPQTVAAVLAFIIVAGLLLVCVKRAVGGKNIVLQTGILLVVFLGLFALGIVSSWRGIMLTSGGVILVGLFMLLYARKAILPEPPTPAPIEEAITEEAEIESDAEMDDEKESELVKQVVVLPTPVPEPMVEVDSELTHSHCPYCARALEEDYAFCPGCGRDTSEVIRCESCGYVQVIPVDAEIRYCVKCGEGLMER